MNNLKIINDFINFKLKDFFNFNLTIMVNRYFMANNKHSA
jgi:hypothetical protein